MKHIVHPAGERGHNRFSWLDSFHSFSFGHFYDENKVHFGALRVLNDDTVSPGMGFGTHPHDNMEIVSIPLSGALEHKDSMGSHGIIRSGDVQIMSAGTGVSHSEFNHSKDEEVKFLQIWVFPRERNVTPRYDQKSFDLSAAVNRWQIVVDPEGKEGVEIGQESWFSIANLESGATLNYPLHRDGNGVYFFLLSGTLEAESTTLNARDAIGLWETENVALTASSDSRVLAIEVSMQM